MAKRKLALSKDAAKLAMASLFVLASIGSFKITNYTLDKMSCSYLNTDDWSNMAKVYPSGEFTDFGSGDNQIGATITYYYKISKKGKEQFVFAIAGHQCNGAYDKDIPFMNDVSNKTDGIRKKLIVDTKVGAYGEILATFDVGDMQEIGHAKPVIGPGKILTSLATDSKPEYYDIIITGIEENGYLDDNDIAFEFCDKNIKVIHGMSGSPLMQLKGSEYVIVGAVAAADTERKDDWNPYWNYTAYNYGHEGYARSIEAMINKNKELLKNGNMCSFKADIYPYKYGIGLTFRFLFLVLSLGMFPRGMVREMVGEPVKNSQTQQQKEIKPF